MHWMISFQLTCIAWLCALQGSVGCTYEPSLSFIELQRILTDMLPLVNDELPSEHSMVVNPNHPSQLIIGLRVQSKSGCIVSLPSRGLNMTATVIAGVCGELKTDAELFKDGSLGSMKSPDNLNIKSNGDILFTDDTMCLRTLKKGALRTLLGTCGVSFSRLDLDMTYSSPAKKIKSALYIEDKDMMVYAINGYGVIGGPLLGPTRLLLAASDVCPLNDDSFTLARSGNVIWHKVYYGVNKYDMSQVNATHGVLTIDGNAIRFFNYADGANSGTKDQTAKYYKNKPKSNNKYMPMGTGEGLAVHPHLENKLLLKADYANDGGKDQMNLMLIDTSESNSAPKTEKICRHTDSASPVDGGSGCELKDDIAPLWVEDNMAIVYSITRSRFGLLTFDLEKDNCKSSPCFNGATCIDDGSKGPGQWECVCPAEWTGVRCRLEADMCAGNNQCGSYGDCFNLDGPNIICICHNGWTGSQCAEWEDQCALHHNCGPYGTCQSKGRGTLGYDCHCAPDWTGTYCNRADEYCTAGLCQNGGTCEEFPGQKTYCICAPGYTGDMCQTAVTYCKTDICAYGGTCVEVTDGYTCQCTIGWAGDRCQDDIPECGEQTCNRKGECKERLGGGTLCICDEGNFGPTCNFNVDPCFPTNPCVNGASCNPNQADFTCDCPDGFTGQRCQVDVQECESTTCQNGGTCKEKIGLGTICLCVAGFEGYFCEVNTNECLPNPCLHGGSCEDKVDHFICTCDENTIPKWEGRICETMVSPCLTESCSNNGQCHVLADAGRTLCECDAGWTGTSCDVSIDDCSTNPCHNGGTCEDGHLGFTCTCKTYKTGIQCQEDITECQPTTCTEHGECKEKRYGGTFCVCDPGYIGDDCGESINECRSDPCQRGGTCQDIVNGYVCDCPSHRTGVTCQEDIIDCDCDSCNGHGQCKELRGGGYICLCEAGWRGSTKADCSINIDDCKPNPCGNGGVCEDLVLDYECVCTAGWTGKRCNKDIPDCTDTTCNGKGICKEKRGGGALCVCERGFTGLDCSINRDDCWKQLCKHGATCQDGIDSFTCLCAEGWTGRYCHVKT